VREGRAENCAVTSAGFDGLLHVHAELDVFRKVCMVRMHWSSAPGLPVTTERLAVFEHQRCLAACCRALAGRERIGVAGNEREIIGRGN